MTYTTGSGSSSASSLIKTDKLGRMHTPPERREILLDEFEQSGMSAAAFASVVGIKYQTFAGWRHRRAKAHRSTSTPPASDPGSLHLVEAVMEGHPIGGRDRGGLIVHLPGQASLELSRADQLPLICALLKSLEGSHRSC